jgi:probable phosphoglycerate mutase
VFKVFSQRVFIAARLIFAKSLKIEFTVTLNSSPENTKTIYLIRHGQTDFNKQGIIQGSGVDSDLNEIGQMQASQFFSHYKSIPFQRIFASSLKRTQQTVAPFFELNIPLEIIPELDEINWGKMEGALPNKETTDEFLAMIQLWRAGNLDIAVQGGETPRQLFERQKIGLQKIEQIPFASPALICMHGRAMRSFLCLLTGYPLHLMDDFEHGNVCLYQLEKNLNAPFYSITLHNSYHHFNTSPEFS